MLISASAWLKYAVRLFTTLTAHTAGATALLCCAAAAHARRQRYTWPKAPKPRSSSTWYLLPESELNVSCTRTTRSPFALSYAPAGSAPTSCVNTRTGMRATSKANAGLVRR